jgi:hypothetical protein
MSPPPHPTSSSSNACAIPSVLRCTITIRQGRTVVAAAAAAEPARHINHQASSASALPLNTQPRHTRSRNSICIAFDMQSSNPAPQVIMLQAYFSYNITSIVRPRVVSFNNSPYSTLPFSPSSSLLSHLRVSTLCASTKKTPFHHRSSRPPTTACRLRRALQPPCVSVCVSSVPSLTLHRNLFGVDAQHTYRRPHASPVTVHTRARACIDTVALHSLDAASCSYSITVFAGADRGLEVTGSNQLTAVRTPACHSARRRLHSLSRAVQVRPSAEASITVYQVSATAPRLSSSACHAATPPSSLLPCNRSPFKAP